MTPPPAKLRGQLRGQISALGDLRGGGGQYGRPTQGTHYIIIEEGEGWKGRMEGSRWKARIEGGRWMEGRKVKDRGKWREGYGWKEGRWMEGRKVKDGGK